MQEASKQAVEEDEECPCPNDDDRLMAEQLGRELDDLCPEKDAHARNKIALRQARFDDMDKAGICKLCRRKDGGCGSHYQGTPHQKARGWWLSEPAEAFAYYKKQPTRARTS